MRIHLVVLVLLVTSAATMGTAASPNGTPIGGTQGWQGPNSESPSSNIAAPHQPESLVSSRFVAPVLVRQPEGEGTHVGVNTGDEFGTRPILSAQKMVSSDPLASSPVATTPGPNYNERLGMTFVDSSVKLSYNVTAVIQSDVDGFGPGYLLNGLSNLGYWYQVGIAWNWPSLNGGHAKGFYLLYAVFDPTGKAVYPKVCCGGIQKFSGVVKEHDLLNVSLSFVGKNVSMRAYDWNTKAASSQSYNAFGATSFSGLTGLTSNQNGFFTGLMTEWYHTRPYSNNEAKVVYSQSSVAQSSSLMWLDEFNTKNTSQVLFSANSGQLLYMPGGQLYSLFSNGASEFSNAHTFITGQLTVSFTLSYSPRGGGLGYSSPMLTYVVNGTVTNADLFQYSSKFLLDYGSGWSLSPSLPGSTSVERWQTSQKTDGTATTNMTLNFVYNHQYYLAVLGGSGGMNGQGWYNGSSVATATSLPTFGRASGSGQRVTSFTFHGITTGVLPGTGQVSVQVLMNGPQAVSFGSVIQYQLALDAGAASGLASVSQPTISGDNYWYDAGTSVSLTLNGIWGRSNGGGVRIVAYLLNAGVPSFVATKGQISILASVPISSPIFVHAALAIQYELSSVGGSLVFASNPPIPGDPGWYDRGTTALASYNYTWNSVPSQSRLNAISYTVDNNSSTSLVRAGSGTFVVSRIMNAPHVIRVNAVAQYLLDIRGGANVTSSPASPTSDLWFDSGTVVGISSPRVTGLASNQSRWYLMSFDLDGKTTPIGGTDLSTVVLPGITMNSYHVFKLSFAKQYLISVTFTDSSGQKQLWPSSFRIDFHRELFTHSNITSMWLEDGITFSIVDVTWEGAPVQLATPAKFIVTGPLHLVIGTKVYSLSIKVVDGFGIPVWGASLQVTLANGTTLSRNTGSDGSVSFGLVPVGSYSGSVTNLGVSNSIAGDASIQSPPPARARLSLAVVGALTLIIAVIAGLGLSVTRRRARLKTFVVSRQRVSTVLPEPVPLPTTPAPVEIFELNASSPETVALAVLPEPEPAPEAEPTKPQAIIAKKPRPRRKRTKRKTPSPSQEAENAKVFPE